MGRPFVGRWSLRTRDPVAFPGGRLPPDALAEKYEQVKLEARRPELPLAKAQELWWVSRGSVRRVGLVSFEAPSTAAIAQLVVAVQVRPDGPQVALVPSILLDVRNVQPGCSVQEHNAQVSDVHEGFLRSAGALPSLREITKMVDMALRRLATLEHSFSFQQKG
jgi:hypothetical protein